MIKIETLEEGKLLTDLVVLAKNNVNDVGSLTTLVELMKSVIEQAKEIQAKQQVIDKALDKTVKK